MSFGSVRLAAGVAAVSSCVVWVIACSTSPSTGPGHETSDGGDESTGGVEPSGGRRPDGGDGGRSGGQAQPANGAGAGPDSSEGGAAGAPRGPESAICGDGTVDVGEDCDDANDADADGCSKTCRLERGFACKEEPSICRVTTCGDGANEGSESCDDRNTRPLDGCDPSCQTEPTCDDDNGCQSECGDGILLGEACDDGNTRAGDGCSPSCTIEPGFDCKQPSDCEKIGGECVLRLPVIYRDFTDTHPDMEPTCMGTDEGRAATPGLVQALLRNGVPVATANAAQAGCIKNLEDWYSDTGAPAVVRELVLFDNGKGAYVNRYGDQGEQWESLPKYTNPRFCGVGDTHCMPDASFAGCDFDPLVDSCFYPCPPALGAKGDTCAAVISVPPTKYDGTPFFFPLDDQPKKEVWSDAKVPVQYGFNWEFEDQVVPLGGIGAHVAGAALHNFHFTTQLAYWFRYDAAMSTALEFTGDDDVWMFVNGKLAVDLGGVHQPVSGSVTLDASTAASFGLKNGGVYRIDLFHAERKRDSSTLRLSLPKLNLSRSECKRL